MSDEFNFSAEPVKINVTISGNKYILKECTEDAYTAYSNVIAKGVSYSEEGGVSRNGGEEADTLLLQRCLFEVAENGNELPTKLDFIRGLPRRITKPLYTKLRDISGLDEGSDTIESVQKRIEKDTKKLAKLKKGETEAKND